MAGARRVERDDEDLVRLYLTEVGRHELLSKDDEARLAQQIEEASRANRALTEPGRVFTPNERRTLRRTARRGAEAHDVFVQANLRLVVSIAKKYQASGLPLLDLVQDGNVGLIHAVEKFDWRKGFKFSTYATWWIRQAISRASRTRLVRFACRFTPTTGLLCSNACAQSLKRSSAGRRRGPNWPTRLTSRKPRSST